MPYKVLVREGGDIGSLQGRSRRIADALLDLGMTHAVGVPENGSRFIFEYLGSSSSCQVVPVCREGEAWAIASGLWIGGKSPVMIIQNTGLLESGDAFRGTAVEMRVPLLALIGYRGYRSLSREYPDSAATFLNRHSRHGVYRIQSWRMVKNRESLRRRFRRQRLVPDLWRCSYHDDP